MAHRAYIAHVQKALAAPLPAVTVLGIDETRRGKPKWEQDPTTLRWRLAHDRWHTGIVDASPAPAVCSRTSTGAPPPK